MNQTYERRFGENIRRARERRGMTQETLAAQLQIMGCDVTRGALAKMETGLRHVYPDEIRCLCACLRVRYETLFEGEDGPEGR